MFDFNKKFNVLLNIPYAFSSNNIDIILFSLCFKAAKDVLQNIQNQLTTGNNLSKIKINDIKHEIKLSKISIFKNENINKIDYDTIYKNILSNEDRYSLKIIELEYDIDSNLNDKNKWDLINEINDKIKFCTDDIEISLTSLSNNRLSLYTKLLFINNTLTVSIHINSENMLYNLRFRNKELILKKHIRNYSYKLKLK